MQTEIVDDAERARAVVAAGGVLDRHFVRMVRSLQEGGIVPAAVPGYALEPFTALRIDDYARVVCAAYGANHPDHGPEDDDPDAAARVLTGYERAEGASVHVADERGSIAGVVVVTDRDGPWISELAVDPANAGRGLGAMLVDGACARLVTRGERALGLAVTAGNPARELYARLGFTTTHEIWRFRTPVS